MYRKRTYKSDKKTDTLSFGQIFVRMNKKLAQMFVRLLRVLFAFFVRRTWVRKINFVRNRVSQKSPVKGNIQYSEKLFIDPQSRTKPKIMILLIRTKKKLVRTKKKILVLIMDKSLCPNMKCLAFLFFFGPTCRPSYDKYMELYQLI